MSSKHTPTPWALTTTNSYSCGPVKNSRGFVIETTASNRCTTIFHLPMAGHLEAEATANAHHIVTAVNSHADLLAALEVLCELPNEHRPPWVWDLARAALAKAKGGAS